MADETTTGVPEGIADAEGGAPVSRAQERIQELLEITRNEREARAAMEAELRASREEQKQTLALLSERLPKPAVEEEEWIDPGEKALREQAAFRKEFSSFRAEQDAKERLQKVNYEIQQAVAKLDFKDPSKVAETMAREFYAHKGMGIEDRFDAAATAKKIHAEEAALRTAWATEKKQQAGQTASALTGTSSPPVTVSAVPRPAWGSRPASAASR